MKLFLIVAAYVATFVAESHGHDVCGHYVGDFHLALDTSSSFTRAEPVIKHLAPKLFSLFEEAFPGSRFSIGEFSDKGLAGTGSKIDVCYRVAHPFTNSPMSAANALQRLGTRWGGDYPESQLDALYFSAKTGALDWRSGKIDEHGNPRLRVIILATDATWHEAGDLIKSCKDNWWNPFKRCWTKPRIMPGGITEPSCKLFDYPTLRQVARAMAAKDIIPLFLISNRKVMHRYENLVRSLGRGGTVVKYSSDASDIVEKVKEGLAKISCQTTTTTTTDAPFLPTLPPLPPFFPTLPPAVTTTTTEPPPTTDAPFFPTLPPAVTTTTTEPAPTTDAPFFPTLPPAVTTTTTEQTAGAPTTTVPEDATTTTAEPTSAPTTTVPEDATTTTEQPTSAPTTTVPEDATTTTAEPTSAPTTTVPEDATTTAAPFSPTASPPEPATATTTGKPAPPPPPPHHSKNNTGTIIGAAAGGAAGMMGLVGAATLGAKYLGAGADVPDAADAAFATETPEAQRVSRELLSVVEADEFA